MQIFVLGMHRSGTSVATRLLNMMGAYFGPEGGSTGANEENPKGFWERRDVRKINDAVLHGSGADWFRLGDFQVDTIPAEVREQFDQDAKRVLLELDAHRPWVLKEPRFCVLMPLWLPLLETPVVVHCFRRPIEIALSLRHRNQLPIHTGLAVWERYTLDALTATASVPSVVIRHADVMKDPVGTSRELLAQLQALGVTGLRQPSDREILGFVDPSLYRQKANLDLQQQYITTAQAELYDAIETDLAALLPRLGDRKLSLGAAEVLTDHDSSYAHAAHLEAEVKSAKEEQDQLGKQLSQQQSAYAELKRSSQEALQKAKHELTSQQTAYSELKRSSQEALQKTSEELARQRGDSSEQQKRFQKELRTVKHELTRRQNAYAEFRRRSQEDIQRERLKLKQLKEQFDGLRAEHQARRRMAKKMRGDLARAVRLTRATARSWRWRAGTLVVGTVTGAFLRSRRHFALSALDEVLGTLGTTASTLALPKLTGGSDAAWSTAWTNLHRAPAQVWWATLQPELAAEAPQPPCEGCRGTLTALRHVNDVVSELAIIVPVHNAPTEVGACLVSLVQHTPKDVSIVVIDDASTDPRVAVELQAAARHPNVSVHRNDENLGYTRTINKGIRLAGRADVVFLNSDTVVTSGWVGRLRRAAYSGSRVGTATPLSNNAGAFSAPIIGQDNEIPANNLDDFARAIAQTALRTFPRTPTGNGFCMYVRWDCLQEVGELDEDAFPRGYGEENDFCLRAAQLGWTHVVDDATYIYHKRSASFGAAKEKLIQAGRAVIDERYPDYTRAVRDFLGSPAMDAARKQVAAVAQALQASGSGVKPRALFVLPVLSARGGTPQTNADLMRAVGDRLETFVLQSDGEHVELLLFHEGQYSRLESFKLGQPLEPFPHRNDEYDRVVCTWLERYAFEIVHVRHIALHSLGLMDVARLLGLPIVFSFHDFYTVCPTVKLLDEAGVFCGGTCTADAEDCKLDLWKTSRRPRLKHKAVLLWRNSMKQALSSCDAFVTTSESAKSILLENELIPGAARFDVIPHGRDFARFGEVSTDFTPETEKLRVIVPGSVNRAKGAEILAELAKRLNGQVEFHVLGKLQKDYQDPELFLEHGEYDREDFVRRVAEIRPHVGAVLSIWPETYCHTLTELWAAGVPVVGFPLGAVGERLGATGAGWIAAAVTADAVIDVIESVFANPGELERKARRVERWQETEGRTLSTKWMGQQYYRIYSSLLRETPTVGTASPH